MMQSQPPSQSDLETVGAVARRVFSFYARTGVQPSALGWHELLSNIAGNLAQGHCSRAAAEAEFASLQALDTAPDQEDLQRRISETFYAEPVLRHLVELLASTPAHDISEFPRPGAGFAPAAHSFDPSSETVSIWLDQAAVRHPAVQQPDDERHKPITTADISQLQTEYPRVGIRSMSC